MGFKSRIPEIVQQASLRTQKAVEFAGQEIEFDARRRARKRTGDMAAGIQWKPSRTNRGGLVTSGRVVGKDFKTRWHEYGTKRGLTRPADAAPRREGRRGGVPARHVPDLQVARPR
jgi:hypothetical protein